MRAVLFLLLAMVATALADKWCAKWTTQSDCFGFIDCRWCNATQTCAHYSVCHHPPRYENCSTGWIHPVEAPTCGIVRLRQVLAYIIFGLLGAMCFILLPWWLVLQFISARKREYSAV